MTYEGISFDIDGKYACRVCISTEASFVEWVWGSIKFPRMYE